MFQNERREKMNKGKKLGEAGRVMRISWPLVTKITGDFRFFFFCYFLSGGQFFSSVLFSLLRERKTRFLRSSTRHSNANGARQFFELIETRRCETCSI